MSITIAKPHRLQAFARKALTQGIVWAGVREGGWFMLRESRNTQKRIMLWADKCEAEAEKEFSLKRVVLKSLSLTQLMYDFDSNVAYASIPLLLCFGKSEQRCTHLELKQILIDEARSLGLALPPLECLDALRLERGPGRISFAVDDVLPATEPLPEIKMYAEMRRYLRTDLESCSDYHSEVLSNVNWHPLFSAAYFAYRDHRPLVLSPDTIWLAIAQSAALHIRLHAEELRSRLVAHRGQQTIVVLRPDFIKGSPENPWAEVVDAFSAQLRTLIPGDLHDLFVADFSTTGRAERMAAQITLMEPFKRYFEYETNALCGIPRVTLQGTVADWELLRARSEALARRLGMYWWLEHLNPVCDQFVAAARGEIDVRHWRRMYKKLLEYGLETFSGWICALFAYTRHQGNELKRNPYFNLGWIDPMNLPLPMSCVPFQYSGKTGVYPMEFVAGYTGVKQDRTTLALQPKIGWAVRGA